VKKVLVTGGAGFIGSHTVDLLLERGISVRVLDNLSAGKRSNLPVDDPGLECLEGDIRDSRDVARAVEGVTHVLHLAAQVSVVNSLEDPPNSADHNIMGFVVVLDAARHAGVERFVYASSAAIYGTPEHLPLDESAPLAPLSPYGLEKQVDEQYAALFHDHWGISTLGMRYFNVFGPRQDPSSPYAGVISLFASRIRAGEPLTVFGDGRQTRDFVYVRDVARANVAALTSGHNGACNVATGTTVTLLDVIDALGSVTGRKPEVSFLPPREGDIRDSSAAVDTLQRELGVNAETTLAEGLDRLLSGTE
jgi:UDP-glucose 4-epimerase